MAEVPQNEDDLRDSVGSPLTPSAIEAKADASIDNVLKFFASHGVELKKRPKVRYSDMPCPLNNRAAAMANTDVESMKGLLSMIGASLTRASYRRFGLTVSDEAMQEALAVSNGYLSEVFRQVSLFGEGTDVALFPPIQNMLDEMDSTVGHEMWHLKEEENGLLVDESMLREATATYVENLIAGKSSLNPQIRDHFDVVYKYGAAIVEEELLGVVNPLQALLDPEVRRKLDAKFQEKVMPLFERKVSETFDPSLSEGYERQLLRTDEAYVAFRNNPSADTYLEALRRRGYAKLADDFAKQDLTQIVKHGKRLLS